jgi:hypothetical protein
MKKTAKNTIKKLANIDSCQYCFNCKYSYIQEETGHGFCKYGEYKGFVKNIQEMHTCEHWEKK